MLSRNPLIFLKLAFASVFVIGKKEDLSMTDKILRCKEVQQAIGLSRSTIYRMIERGDFPRPQKLGLRAIGWRESAISEWMEAR